MENLPEDYFVTSHQFVKTTYTDVYPSIDPKAASNSQAGKVIVITGATKGLGHLAFARSFAQAGAKGIVIAGRSADALKEVTKDIQAINKNINVLPVATDIRNAESVASLWWKVKEEFGHADVLINNAATFGNNQPVAEASPDSWWNDFETNVHGTFLATQGFLKVLGKERKGTIINITTAAALQVLPTMSSYSISKLAILQLNAFVAAENSNVRAITLHPGIILTDMTTEVFKRFAHDTPELVGGVGVWLATEKAAFLNGKYLASNWSVDDLVARKDEILSEGKLSVGLIGKVGKEQFE